MCIVLFVVIVSNNKLIKEVIEVIQLNMNDGCVERTNWRV